MRQGSDFPGCTWLCNSPAAARGGRRNGSLPGYTRLCNIPTATSEPEDNGGAADADSEGGRSEWSRHSPGTLGSGDKERLLSGGRDAPAATGGDDGSGTDWVGPSDGWAADSYRRPDESVRLGQAALDTAQCKRSADKISSPAVYYLAEAAAAGGSSDGALSEVDTDRNSDGGRADSPLVLHRTLSVAEWMQIPSAGWAAKLVDQPNAAGSASLTCRPRASVCRVLAV